MKTINDYEIVSGREKTGYEAHLKALYDKFTLRLTAKKQIT